MSARRSIDVNDWKDVGIRAIKTTINVAIGLLGADVLGWVNLGNVKAAGIAALSAGASVIINAVLAWSTET